jgi:tryptophan synthase alpha chain
MAHMVAAFPDRERSLAIARALAEGGASMIEVQFPFSDPMADGPDIQAACARALEAGFTVADGFRIVREICAACTVPVFIMSYANLLFAKRIDGFLAEAKNAGAQGVIVPDLPPDYDEGLFKAADELGLSAVPVLSPSMREERLQRVARLGARYLYATLRTGTTGRLTEIDPPSIGFLQRLARRSPEEPPRILGGFGIATREQVRAVENKVYAVVVGSALVREAAKGGDVARGVRSRLQVLVG